MLAALFAMAVVVFISDPIRLLIRTNWVLLNGLVAPHLALFGGLPT